MSVERAVRVRVGSEEREAVAFTTRPERASLDGPISARFIEALVRGARDAGLPGDYVAGLQARVGAAAPPTLVSLRRP